MTLQEAQQMLKGYISTVDHYNEPPEISRDFSGNFSILFQFLVTQKKFFEFQQSDVIEL